MAQELDSRVGLIWVVLLYSAAWTILTKLLCDKPRDCPRSE